MGFAKHNRGTRSLVRAIDNENAPLRARAAFHAIAAENRRLRASLALLTHTLQRARRCLRAERQGREALRLRLQEAERNYATAMDILSCKIRRYDPNW